MTSRGPLHSIASFSPAWKSIWSTSTKYLSTMLCIVPRDAWSFCFSLFLVTVSLIIRCSSSLVFSISWMLLVLQRTDSMQLMVEAVADFKKVLICSFSGIPVNAVTGTKLSIFADGSLFRMFCTNRTRSFRSLNSSCISEVIQRRKRRIYFPTVSIPPCGVYPRFNWCVFSIPLVTRVIVLFRKLVGTSYINPPGGLNSSNQSIIAVAVLSTVFLRT